MFFKQENIIIGLLTLLIIGCDKISSKFDSDDHKQVAQPEWANQILSRTINFNSLVGEWDYSSIISYDNSDCSGEGESYDYSGQIIYEEINATRNYTTIYTFLDFDDEFENYSITDFQNDCQIKGGIYSNASCEISGIEELEYFLTDNGYCEIYLKEEYSVTYCGSIIIEDNIANITFTWD